MSDHSRRRRSLALPVTLSVTLLLAASAAGCSPSAPDHGVTGPQLIAAVGARTALAAARARWAAAAPAHYQYVFSRSCECLPEVSRQTWVEVRRSAGNPEVITSLTYVSGSAVDTRIWAQFPTVEGLFAIVRDALDRHAAKLDVTYDPQLGYPRSISIDYDAVLVDDEVVYRASELGPLP